MTGLRQQLKQSSQKVAAAEAKYATHAGSMAALQSRTEAAEATTLKTQRSLVKLQVQSVAWASASFHFGQYLMASMGTS